MTTMDAPTTKTLTPRDLKDFDETLYVENLSHSKIFHEDLQHPGITLELGPVTSETRFGILPIEIARNSSFQKIWRRGQVKISADASMEDVLSLADSRMLEVEAKRQAAVAATIDTSQTDQALVPVKCLECKVETFQTQLDIVEGAPPLCLDHRHHQGQWVQSEVFDESIGEVRSSWSKIKLGTSQPGLSEE